MSECGCVLVGDDDGDCATVSQRTERCARRPHVCCECRDTIRAGARYEEFRGLFDGDWQTFKTCLTCVEIRHLLMCEGFNFCAVWDDIREHWREGGHPQGCIDKLTSVAAKQKLAAAYRDFLGLPAGSSGVGEG